MTPRRRLLFKKALSEYVTSVTISGTQIVSYVLTATYIGSGGSPTYQWKRGGSNISGANSATYTLVAADSGQAITCLVTIGSASATSNTLTIVRTLLDEYPLSSARVISAGRLMKGNNTSPFVQRKSSGGTINASYNSNGTINESALTSFLGSDDGFIATFYEQNGSGFNATQGSAAKQAKNAIAGVLQKQSGELVGKWIDSQYTEYTKTAETISNAFTVLLKCYYTQSSNSNGSMITTSSRPIPILHKDYGAVYRYESFQYEPMASISGYVTIAWVRNGTSLKVYRNGTLISSSVSGPTGSISFDLYLAQFFGSYLTADIKTLAVYPAEYNATDIATMVTLL